MPKDKVKSLVFKIKKKNKCTVTIFRAAALSTKPR